MKFIKILAIVAAIVNLALAQVNINTATKKELMMLPGIGESKAEAIIEYRKTTKFKTIEDIKNVKGIGEKRFEKIKSDLSVTGKTDTSNLKSAKAAKDDKKAPKKDKAKKDSNKTATKAKKDDNKKSKSEAKKAKSDKKSDKPKKSKKDKNSTKKSKSE